MAIEAQGFGDLFVGFGGGKGFKGSAQSIVERGDIAGRIIFPRWTDQKDDFAFGFFMLVSGRKLFKAAGDDLFKALADFAGDGGFAVAQQRSEGF